MSGAGLHAWLSQRRVPALWRESAAHALATPWCWPTEAALVDHARALGYAAPAPPVVGEVLLVSVAAHVDRATLWRLTWDARRPVGGKALGDEALRSLDDVAGLATAVAPHLHSLRMLGERPRTAVQVLKRGPHADAVLEGPSFGLSLLLALSSRLTDRPVASRFAASAAVRGDGSLGPVGGLDRKLALLADGALGVDTVLVAAEQLAEARAILAGHPRLGAVGVATARAAIDHVFPGARDAPPPAWIERLPYRALDELLALCSRGGDVREWRAVERSARWLERLFAEVPHRRDRARLARQIAERHANGRDFAIPWDETIDAARDRERAAHAVQAAADAGSPELGAYLDRARALLRAVPDDDDLRLLGALGRGLAAMRRYPEAAAALADATQAWTERDNPAEGSRPLAEWVRVAALLDDRAAWERAQRCARVHLADASTGDLGALFVRYALGRGLCTTGDARAALTVLDAPDWTAAPSWLARSRGRWRARCLHALGRADEAQAERAALAAAVDDDSATPVEARFAALDEARERGGDLDAAVGAVRGASPQGAGWLGDAALTATEQARRLADEYPY